MFPTPIQRLVEDRCVRRTVFVHAVRYAAALAITSCPLATAAATENEKKQDPQELGTDPELTEAREERLENENIVGYQVQERERRSGPGGTQGDEDRHFDDGTYFYLAPGALNVPYAGQDRIDYEDTFDPGYQWGLGLGWMVRTDSPFAIGVGGYFDHAIVNLEARDLDSGDFRHQFRVGLELKPGVVFKDRVFLYVPLRGGYAVDVRDIGDNDLEANHGAMFGVGGGLDVAVKDRFYIGTALATDLQFFTSDRDFEMYSFAWRVHLGWRFGDNGNRR